jgi:hypothetical protein
MVAILRGERRMNSSCAGFRLWILVVALTVVGDALARGESSSSTLATTTRTSADQLIAAAAQAEIAGDNSRSTALLQELIRKYPENSLAHARLGQIKLDGKWVTLEEAQQRASADPKQIEYRERRAAAGDSPEGQLALAKWCRRNNLNDEARLHWASVLSADPTNSDALRALEMRLRNGRLISKTDAEALKDAGDDVKNKERWAARVAKWQNALAGKNKLSPAEAIDEIHAIKTIDAIPAIEAATLRSNLPRQEMEQRHNISVAFMEALEKMPAHAATESLVRYAMYSAFSDVRGAAIKELRKRPMHDYVPQLLDNLTMPLESHVTIGTSPDGTVHYRHNLYRGGATADYASTITNNTFRQTNWYPNSDPSDPLVMRQRDENAARNAVWARRRYNLQALTLQNQIHAENRATNSANNQITSFLAAVTGQDFGANPREWWGWWQNYNEYYMPESRPVYEQNTVNNNYISDDLPMMSCFAKGTPVWTKTGQRPIESLEMGDLVLSQDVNTGSLKYQPIVGRTVRPPCQILKISVDGESIRTTKGHPFWVSGAGWRMAKELDDGARLCATRGSSGITKIVLDGQEEAYNLVVADYSTYFVGEHGLLVHDNSPRKPSHAVLPGVLKK